MSVGGRVTVEWNQRALSIKWNRKKVSPAVTAIFFSLRNGNAVAGFPQIHFFSFQQRPQLESSTQQLNELVLVALMRFEILHNPGHLLKSATQRANKLNK